MSFLEKGEDGFLASECHVRLHAVAEGCTHAILPSSRLLTIGDVEYKWKPGSESSGIHETRPKNRKGSYHDVWKIWSCVATQGPTTSSSNQGGLPNYSLSNATNGAHATAASHLEANGVYSPMLSAAASINSLESIAMQHLPSNIASIKVIISLILTAPAPPTVLARFAPPQPGLPYNEITLFPRILDSPDSSDALFTLEQLLTSAILLATTKGEWKRVQSLNGPPALQEILTAEATGQVPPYTPTFGRTLERGPGQANGGRGQRNRADSSPARRTIQYRGVESYSENDSENAPLLSQRSSNHQATPSSAHWFSSSGSSSAQRTDLRKPSRSALPAGAMYSRSRESQANDGILTGPHRSLQSRYPTDARITPILGSHTNDAEPRRPTTGPPPIYRA